MFRKLTILGPGLLGGSIGLAARHRKVAQRVALWARRTEAADEARGARGITRSIVLTGNAMRVAVGARASSIGGHGGAATRMKKVFDSASKIAGLVSNETWVC